MTHQASKIVGLDFDTPSGPVTDRIQPNFPSVHQLTPVVHGTGLSITEYAKAFIELTKPRITIMVVLVAAAGYFLGANLDAFNYLRLIEMLLGVALLSSGVATLNQFMERNLDSRMRRTAQRPLPSGKLSPQTALIFGLALVAIAEAYLWLRINALTAVLGLAVVVGYLLCYTPSKTRTWWSTFVGAVPGAVPPLVGWAAARGVLNWQAWMLFAILFLWQFPHFFAIAWMYREDYERAGICVLPVVDPQGQRTARQIRLYSTLLVMTGMMPVITGMAGLLYGFCAALLGVMLLYSGFVAAARINQCGGERAVTQHSHKAARGLLLASVLYLPLLVGAMVIDKKVYWTANSKSQVAVQAA